MQRVKALPHLLLSFIFAGQTGTTTSLDLLSAQKSATLFAATVCAVGLRRFIALMSRVCKRDLMWLWLPDRKAAT